MNDKNILKPIKIVAPNSLATNDVFLGNIDYPMFPDDEIKIFRSGQHLVLWSNYFCVFTKQRRSTQQEFPITALPWFIETIENKFWNHKPDLNALPGDVSESTVIDGEKIGINPSRNCCGENVFGYTFWNASRKEHIGNLAPQEWDVPRFMLEDGLLDELKKISANLGLKQY